MSSKPNVVLMLVDDMGFAELGITGSEIGTPNIDRLANDGVLLAKALLQRYQGWAEETGVLGPDVVLPRLLDARIR